MGNEITLNTLPAFYILKTLSLEETKMICKFIIRDIPLINILLSMSQGIPFPIILKYLKYQKHKKKKEKKVALKPEPEFRKADSKCLIFLRNTHDYVH